MIRIDYQLTYSLGVTGTRRVNGNRAWSLHTCELALISDALWIWIWLTTYDVSAAFRLTIGVDISNPLCIILLPYVPPQSPWLPFKPNITLLVYFCHNICHFSPCFELGLYSWSNRLLANEVIRSETLVTPQAEGQGGIRPCLFDHKYNYKPFLPCFYCFSLAW